MCAHAVLLLHIRYLDTSQILERYVKNHLLKMMVQIPFNLHTK